MSEPASAVDSKTAPLLDQVPTDAPPSYTETPKQVARDVNAGPTNNVMMYSVGLSQPYHPRERRSWNFGFFDCFRAPGASVKAFFCPWLSYGQTRHRLLSPNTDVPIISTPCLGYFTAALCCPGAESIFGLLNRSDIRHRLAIDQDPHQNPDQRQGPRSSGPLGETMFENLPKATGFLDDSLRHIFCGCCALVQEDREVSLWHQQLREQNVNYFAPEHQPVREEEQRLLVADASELVA